MLMSQLASANFKFDSNRRDGDQRHVAFSIEQSKGNLLKKQYTDTNSSIRDSQRPKNFDSTDALFMQM